MQLVIEDSCDPVILDIELLELRVGVEDVTLQLTDHQIVVVLEGATAVAFLQVRDLILLDVRRMTSKVVGHRPLIVLLDDEEDDSTDVSGAHEDDFAFCDQAVLWVEVRDGT